MIKIGIVGASGVAGKNLIQLTKDRNDVILSTIVSTTQQGQLEELSGLHYSDLCYEELNELDLVFVAVPHGDAKEIVQNLRVKVIDMSADYRLSETYGMPEIHKNEIKKARIIANPGCYATACILSVYPIREIVDYVIFDGISGYSGAGKKAKMVFDYQSNAIAYQLTDHFHLREIEKYTETKSSFTPHVVDMYSGLMCTAHIFLNENQERKDLMARYHKFYEGTYTKVIDRVPSTKDVVNTPHCLIGGFEKDKHNQLVVVSVIDNLWKGAASQAVENMEILFNLQRSLEKTKFSNH
jgi:N-acetyl-gamma-glutamyl-phosphate reductase